MPEPTIVDVRMDDQSLIEALTDLAFDAFRVHAPSWLTTREQAREEVVESLEPGRRSRALIDTSGQPIAWIGVIPQSHGRVWEIHPLGVRSDRQGQGHGRRLVEDVERLARQHGVLTLLAGTSDETGDTSLFGADLYTDPPAAMANLTIQRFHACGFWRHIGFQVVGVIPDAEGAGRPSILLARSVPRARIP